MRFFSALAVLALPLLSPVLADPTPSKSADGSIYASAHEAFQDLLNALPEESLQAALSGLKDFKDGVFESHHRGVEHVHDSNPALATKLIVAAVQDLKKRQLPSNQTTPATPQASGPAIQQTPSSNPPAAQSSARGSANTPAASPSTTTDRAVIVQVATTTTDASGRTIVSTTSVLSEPTASVTATITTTNSAGSTITATTLRPAVLISTTDSAGRPSTLTSVASFAPTAGEVIATTDSRGSTVLSTYTPDGGKISSVKLITTTGSDGRQSVITSYTFVDPAAATGNTAAKSSAKPGLQNVGARAAPGALEVVVIGIAGWVGWFV